MSFKKKDILEINEALNSLLSSGEVKSKNLVYAIIKNTKLVEPEVTALSKALETDSEEFKTYVEETREIYGKYADIDEQGNIKTVPGGIVLKDPTTKDEVSKLIVDLDDKYKDAIEARKVEIEKYNEILDEDVEIDFYKIKLEYLPEEIEPRVLYILDPIVEA